MISSLRLVLHLPFETTRGAITPKKKKRIKKPVKVNAEFLFILFQFTSV